LATPFVWTRFNSLFILAWVFLWKFICFPQFFWIMWVLCLIFCFYDSLFIKILFRFLGRSKAWLGWKKDKTKYITPYNSDWWWRTAYLRYIGMEECTQLCWYQAVLYWSELSVEEVELRDFFVFISLQFISDIVQLHPNSLCFNFNS
jgi:hypothetical protein